MEDLQPGKNENMISDQLKYIGRYPFLKQIQEFNFENYQKGRFEISGNEFFGIGLEYETRDASECLWEAHRRNLDVHCILEGEELIHIADIAHAVVTKEYDEEGDYALFDAKKEQTILLKEGMFLVLYPNEVHQTSVAVNTAQSLKKIVFKIAL